jgi:hypothetical protein
MPFLQVCHCQYRLLEIKLFDVATRESRVGAGLFRDLADGLLRADDKP